ncbi:MAG: hypothetical protein HON99_05145 [Crocinitomicaceae bacterium]|nr:hypothetical protein [Crocinitomicaceae bacterium]MBT6515318.1 hypothetical protein [Crocinitomicaceae bacterium]
MSTINRHNYEEFFLDYHEGNLTGEQKAMVILFIESNEDLLDEFYTFKEMTLEITDTSTIEKSSLYNGPHSSNREDYFIGWIEGDLTSEEKVQTQELVNANASFSKELELFQKTKLTPTAEVYADKQNLRKSARVIPLLKYAVPAAAAVTFFIFLSNNLTHRNYFPQPLEVAEIKLLNLDTINTSKTEFKLNRSVLVELKPAVQKKISLKSIRRVFLSPPEPIVIEAARTIRETGKMPEIQLKQVDELTDEVAELPTILDKVIQTADEKLFGTSENLSTADPIELLVKGIERVTKREAEITRVTLEDRKKTGFKIGKFEFSRSKRI